MQTSLIERPVMFLIDSLRQLFFRFRPTEGQPVFFGFFRLFVPQAAFSDLPQIDELGAHSVFLSKRIQRHDIRSGSFVCFNVIGVFFFGRLRRCGCGIGD